MNDSDLQAARSAYAENVCRIGRCKDSRVQAAFAKVPREKFLGPGPWPVFAAPGSISPTPSDDPVQVYQNVLFALKPELGINNGQPSLHAGCLAHMHIKPGMSALHIGTGTGYYTAILAELVGPQGEVLGLEIEADLAAKAKANLADWPNVRVEARSGTQGALPQSDAIYVNAGATHPLDIWLDALSDGGVLALPLTGAQNFGMMLFVTREGSRYRAEAPWPVGFVSCSGARDEQTAHALTKAVASGALRDTKRLCRDNEPDETALFAWEGGWLSSAPL